MKPLEPVSSDESPREILDQDYKDMGAPLPIRGGWGYTQADACIIDKHDPIVPKGVPFNGIAVEHSFVEMRILEEMVIFRAPVDQYAGIEWKMLKQHYVPLDGRAYDMLEFEITAFPKPMYYAWRAKFEGKNDYLSPDFDQQLHDEKIQSHKLTIVREFWFDITSFMGD